MKEMIYRDRVTTVEEIERLADGNYKGLDYYVLSLGSHPCAYVDVGGTALAGKFYDDIDIDCHFGLTYSEDHLYTVNKKSWFIGWDYAHYTDYSGYMGYMSFAAELKKWTTQEIVDECKAVIDQIVELIGEKHNESDFKN